MEDNRDPMQEAVDRMHRERDITPLVISPVAPRSGEPVEGFVLTGGHVTLEGGRAELLALLLLAEAAVKLNDAETRWERVHPTHGNPREWEAAEWALKEAKTAFRAAVAKWKEAKK